MPFARTAASSLSIVCLGSNALWSVIRPSMLRPYPDPTRRRQGAFCSKALASPAAARLDASAGCTTARRFNLGQVLPSLQHIRKIESFIRASARLLGEATTTRTGLAPKLPTTHTKRDRTSPQPPDPPLDQLHQLQAQRRTNLLRQPKPDPSNNFLHPLF